MLLRLLYLRRTPVRTYARRYRYPRSGMGQLYRAIADEVRARGGTILAATRATGLETRAGRVTARVYVEGPGGDDSGFPSGSSSRRCPCRSSRVCESEPSRAELDAACRRLRFRALVFVNLMFSGATFRRTPGCTWQAPA